MGVGHEESQTPSYPSIHKTAWIFVVLNLYLLNELMHHIYIFAAGTCRMLTDWHWKDLCTLEWGGGILMIKLERFQQFRDVLWDLVNDQSSHEATLQKCGDRLGRQLSGQSIWSKSLRI